MNDPFAGVGSATSEDDVTDIRCVSFLLYTSEGKNGIGLNRILRFFIVKYL